MIVTESILQEIFAQLPKYIDSNNSEFQPKFEWGDQADLLLFLKTISGNKYPLVWLVNGDQSVDNVSKRVTRKCKFIIAKDSRNVTNRNPTVWINDFTKCLNPLLKNIITALEASGATAISGDYVERREANYTEENLMKATDFWNVIVLDVTVIFKDRCVNKIKF